MNGGAESSEEGSPDAGDVATRGVLVVIAWPSFRTGDDAAQARYIHGVERIAAARRADDPVEWRGDRACLRFARGTPGQRARQAWRAARDLWERACLELDVPARVAVLFPRPVALPGSTEEAERLGEQVETLLSTAPERTITAGEEVAFSLPAKAREDLGWLAVGDSGEAVYTFPRDAVTPPPEGATRDLELWTALEEYTESPEIREIRYVGFRLPKRAPPVLDILDVFVPPPAVVRAPGRDARGDEGGSGERVDPAPAPLSERSVLAVLAGHRHIVLLGEPGAGKTTLLRWLAVVASQGHAQFFQEDGRPRVPLLLSVGSLAEALSTSGGGPAEVLPRYFGLEDETSVGDLGRFLERQLRFGRCAVLLDGLDEVRAEDRAAVEAWLSDLGKRFPDNVFVATSRFVGYSGARVPQDAAVAELGPFDPLARSQFVRAFCRAYLRWETGEDRPEAAEAQASALLHAIDSSDRLTSLAHNPFMLSALALIHRAEGRLPRHRVQAYEMVLRTLCETWAEARRLVPQAAPGDALQLAYEEEAIPVLGALALAMHERFPRGVAPVDFVRENIALALRAREEIGEEEALAAAEELLARAGREVQVLLERGPGQWGFLHLTFQELFVAAGLHAAERFEEVAMEHLLEPRWEEILRLGTGYLALVQKRPVAAQRFIARVLAHEAPEPFTRAVIILKRHVALAALLAVEAGDALPPRMQRAVAEAFAEWYCEGPLRDLAETLFLPDDSHRGETWLHSIALSDFAPPVAEAFVWRLTAGTSQGRAAAAFALHVLEAKVPASVIVTALENDPGARTWAFSPLLAREATDEEMEALMGHPDERVRKAVIEAMDGARRPGRVRILASAASDASQTVRRAAVFAREGAARFRVWTGQEPPSPEEDARLLPFLRDPEAQIRSIALGRLGRSTRSEVRAEIERLALEDPSGDVRGSALAWWAGWGGVEAMEQALHAFILGADDSAWHVRIRSLAGWLDLTCAIPVLLTACQSSDPDKRAASGELLGLVWPRTPHEETATQATIEEAVMRLLGDQETLVRRKTLRGLDVEEGPVFDRVLAATRDPDPSIRLAAFEAICRRGVHPALAEGLDDASPEVRASTLVALLSLPSSERPHRLDAAAADPSPLVRLAAARWLNLAAERTDQLVSRLLDDPSKDVQRATLESIANHGLPFPIEKVAPFLSDADASLRHAAARALSTAGDPGMLALVEHPHLPEARAALWAWAERRQWTFPPASPADESEHEERRPSPR